MHLSNQMVDYIDDETFYPSRGLGTVIGHSAEPPNSSPRALSRSGSDQSTCGNHSSSGRGCHIGYHSRSTVLLSDQLAIIVDEGTVAPYRDFEITIGVVPLVPRNSAPTSFIDPGPSVQPSEIFKEKMASSLIH